MRTYLIALTAALCAIAGCSTSTLRSASRLEHGAIQLVGLSSSRDEAYKYSSVERKAGFVVLGGTAYGLPVTIVVQGSAYNANRAERAQWSQVVLHDRTRIEEAIQLLLRLRSPELLQVKLPEPRPRRPISDALALELAQLKVPPSTRRYIGGAELASTCLAMFAKGMPGRVELLSDAYLVSCMPGQNSEIILHLKVDGDSLVIFEVGNVDYDVIPWEVP